MERHDVVVIGGGQAGLSISHELKLLTIEHVVLERQRIGQAWRDRWDSFCLVTPNWMIQLPGRPYAGSDPDGYLPRAEIVAYLEGYVAAFDLPVREGIDVIRVDRRPGGGFKLDTTAGPIEARALIVCSGAYAGPHRPAGAASLPASVVQVDSGAYRNAAALPPGGVLIVGSGQSGCQLADELRQAGRTVVMACGKTGWGPRRISGKDILWWTIETGYLDMTVESLPTPAARLTGNVLGTGHDGGYDLHLRTLRAAGVTLAGHFMGVEGGQLRFAPDLAETAAWGDARYGEFMAAVRRVAAERNLPEPEIEPPAPFAGAAPTALPVAGFGSVIFASGYRPDFGQLLPWPAAFDEMGFPRQVEGASSVIDGLYFAGVHYLRKRKSALLYGVGEDAAIVARSLQEHLGGTVE
jgi:putative flavoprotein involved in K+ transport